MPVASSGSARTKPRKRAAGACEACHARKVRCSLAHTGSPCINCSLDRVACEARATKKRRAGPHGPALRIIPAASSSTDVITASPHPAMSEFGSSAISEVAPAPDPGRCAQSSGAVPTSVTEHRDRGSVGAPYHPLAEHFSHYGGESETGALHTINNGLEDQYAPIYGDPRGISLVSDICESRQKDRSGHVLVPRICPSNLDPETINYLRLKGVFDLPTWEISEMIMQTYFSYVHPFFPVIEARSLIEEFESSLHKLSIHLLWSMFLAAANFADESILKATGFASRKEMKRSMYSKAKALYDAEYEQNKVTLIQAVLLMGFWYADTEDKTGPWHWNGVAIGLCQTIGLHRDPDLSSNHIKSISADDRRLWQQIWWSCFYRETWFSAGMGRPMRIRLIDCNTKMPKTEETEEAFEALSINFRKKYFPEGVRELAQLWRQLLNLTVILSNFLIQQQQADRLLPIESEVQATERQIRACFGQQDETAIHKQSKLIKLHTSHFEIYVESVSLMLYRPFLLHDSAEIPSNNWRSIVEQKARSSAASTNQILNGMISADTIDLCQSIICIALVPTLQTHLLDYASSKPMVQRMGHQHLELCMIVVEELKKTLFGAEILYRMFTKARKQIHDRRALTFAAAPLNSHNEPLTLLGSTTIDLTTDALRDEYQNSEDEFDALSAIWNSDALMTSFGLTYDLGSVLLQTFNQLS